MGGCEEGRGWVSWEGKAVGGMENKRGSADRGGN